MVYNLYTRFRDHIFGGWATNPLQCLSRQELVETIKQCWRQGDLVDDVLNCDYCTFSPEFYRRLEREAGGGTILDAPK